MSAMISVSEITLHGYVKYIMGLKKEFDTHQNLNDNNDKNIIYLQEGCQEKSAAANCHRGKKDKWDKQVKYF
jgi:hypothetical protein